MGRIISTYVRIGVEVDLDEARQWCEEYEGADDTWSDEDCAEAYLVDQYNQGLGCEVEFL